MPSPIDLRRHLPSPGQVAAPMSDAIVDEQIATGRAYARAGEKASNAILGAEKIRREREAKREDELTAQGILWMNNSADESLQQGEKLIRDARTPEEREQVRTDVLKQLDEQAKGTDENGNPYLRTPRARSLYEQKYRKDVDLRLRGVVMEQNEEGERRSRRATYAKTVQSTYDQAQDDPEVAEQRIQGILEIRVAQHDMTQEEADVEYEHQKNQIRQIYITGRYNAFLDDDADEDPAASVGKLREAVNGSGLPSYQQDEWNRRLDSVVEKRFERFLGEAAMDDAEGPTKLAHIADQIQSTPLSDASKKRLLKSVATLEEARATRLENQKRERFSREYTKFLNDKTNNGPNLLQTFNNLVSSFPEYFDAQWAEKSRKDIVSGQKQSDESIEVADGYVRWLTGSNMTTDLAFRQKEGFLPPLPQESSAEDREAANLANECLNMIGVKLVADDGRPIDKAYYEARFENNEKLSLGLSEKGEEVLGVESEARIERANAEVRRERDKRNGLIIAVGRMAKKEMEKNLSGGLAPGEAAERTRQTLSKQFVTEEHVAAQLDRALMTGGGAADEPGGAGAADEPGGAGAADEPGGVSTLKIVWDAAKELNRRAGSGSLVMSQKPSLVAGSILDSLAQKQELSRDDLVALSKAGGGALFRAWLKHAVKGKPEAGGRDMAEAEAEAAASKKQGGTSDAN